jgi:NADH-quinone oxidoreductase subunit C
MMTQGMTASPEIMTLGEISERLRAAIPGCQVEVVKNGSPSAQDSLLLDCAHSLAAAQWLRHELQLDFCSNVTAVDWPDREDPTTGTIIPGNLEVVYHLFSMVTKTGPVVLRLRTANRSDNTVLPSLTPVWRSAEFQEREAFDLFGIVFTGHPDLRRILMWDGFQDHPMRRDYVPPPDDEPDGMGER